MKQEEVMQLWDEGCVSLGDRLDGIEVYSGGHEWVIRDRHSNTVSVRKQGVSDEEIPKALERAIEGVIDEWTTILRAVRGER